jgi:hypothetical protein
MGGGLYLPDATLMQFCRDPQGVLAAFADWFIVECRCCTFYRGVLVGVGLCGLVAGVEWLRLVLVTP